MCSEVNANQERIISERRAKDEELFFVNTSVVSVKFGKEIIKKKKFQGVRYNDMILIQPVYESVDLVANNVAVVRLMDCFALFSLNDGSRLTGFEYAKAERVCDVILLTKDNGCADLYDVRSAVFLHKDGVYEKYNVKDSSTEYVWALKNGFYDYIHRSTGNIISPPVVIMAYDTSYGIYGLLRNNRVCKFDESGYPDLEGLRQAVMNEGGHLTLFNYTYNIRHVIDIYGNILNI